MNILALDFDGVISDSAPEAFVVALQTYADLHHGSRLEGVLETLRDDGGLDPVKVRRHAAYRAFLSLMALGNRAEDYCVMLAIIDGGLNVVDQPGYDAVRGSQDSEFMQQFHRRFYEIRHAFCESDPAGWRRLMGPYDEFISILRRRAGNAELAIATAKDRRSVQLLLADYGIADLFPAPRILDKEAGVSKAAHIRSLSERLDRPCAEISFVDDKVNHLDAVASLGARCVLAAWGYNARREHDLARRRGYVVCPLADAEAVLFDSP